MAALGVEPVNVTLLGSRATKAFYPALSLCDMIFPGVFERHPRLTLAIVEFELSGALRIDEVDVPCGSQRSRASSPGATC